MQIDIPQDDYERLAKQADAAGYADVPAFISALASDPIEDPRGPLSEKELHVSIARLKQADASIDAGKGIEAEEAFRRIAAKHSLQSNS